MKNLILILLFAPILFTGCFAKQNFSAKNPYKIKTKIDGLVSEITIKDTRQNVVERNIKIPRGTFPGMKDEISQKLNEGTENLIKGQINSIFNQKTKNTYRINFNLKKGIIGFKARTFSEKEYANVIVEITSIDQNNIEKVCSSTIFLERESMDASPQFVQILFYKALTDAIHKCFGELNK